MGVCNCSMFCCTLFYVHSSIAIILMGKRELVALLNLSSWCLLMVERLFLAVPQGCLRFMIVVFPDHTQLLFMTFGCILRYFLLLFCSSDLVNVGLKSFRHWVSCKRNSSYSFSLIFFLTLHVFLSRSEDVHDIWL